jgi:hypothetical protein
MEWNEIKLQGQDGLAGRAAKKLKNEELLMVQLGGTRLRHELERVPLWRGNHVGLKQLAEDMARYLYLPRLRDPDVLLEAVRDGLSRLTWQSETFAYAEDWDEARGRYQGLKAGGTVRVLLDGQSLLVKPDVAVRQLEEDRRPTDRGNGGTGTGDGSGTDSEGAKTGGTTGGATKGDDGGVKPKPPKLGRFYGSVMIDPKRLGRDASRIAEEVVQHFTALVAAGVEITLEIRAELPDGASDKLVRDVTENCRTLKFDSFEFAEE